MNRRTRINAFCMIASLSVLAGCTLQPKHWAQSTDQLSIPAADVDRLNVQTHNGKITVTGDDGAGDKILVTVKRRGGANSVESAQQCLDAIEIVSQSGESRSHDLNWRFASPKQRGWRTQVSFDVTLPTRLAATITTHNGGVHVKDINECQVTTHNGGVTAEGIRGKTDVNTHNGGVKIASTGGTVRAHTHNGGITAACPSGQFELETHNGGIKLDATGANNLTGNIQTFNGGITVKIDDEASATFACETNNGGINCGPCQVAEKHKRSAVCVAGTGETKVAIRTYNGGIRIGG